jgi:recombination protein RecR
MKSGSDAMKRLIEELGNLPGIGPRSAERLAFSIAELPSESAERLARAISDVKKLVKTCSICCNFSETDPCPICADASRDRTTICVVEQSNDVWAIEKSGVFKGLYHVLKGRCAEHASFDDERQDRLELGELVRRCRGDGVVEVIIATNPNLQGDTRALRVREALTGICGGPSNGPLRLTRLARGMAAGSTLQYANRAVISDALEGRK